jgi:hypothetical protein
MVRFIFFANVASRLNAELDGRFPTHVLLDTMDDVYSQYGMQEEVDESHSKHIETIKLCYFEVYSVETRVDLKTILILSSWWELEAHITLFRFIAMFCGTDHIQVECEEYST